MKKYFYRTGTVFFVLASLFVVVLIYKAWVWYNWLHRMDDTFGLLDL